MIVSDWVSVNDELPKIDETVLMAHFHRDVFVWISSGERQGNNIWGCDWDDDEFLATHYHTVTHWMPLPEPPNSED